MKIIKSQYIFISGIILLSFWDFRPITSLFNKNIMIVMSYCWSIFGYFHFRKYLTFPIKCFKNYNWIWIYIFIGVFISMFNAYFFHQQSILTTFFAQRYIYAFIFTPVLFYIQPSLTDIIKAIRNLSYITVLVWLLSIISPTLIGSISEDSIERRISVEKTTDIGYNVTGMYIVIFYIYYLIQRYITKFSYKRFIEALLWISFIFLYQNRSFIIGVLLVFIYSIYKLKSRIKPLIIISIFIICCIALYYTKDIWYSLMNESESQIGNKDYNRWKSLYYYFNEYSPNLWCYLTGNGFPSIGNSSFGNLMDFNMSNGIYASDLGLIGMWTDYGVLPLIGIYFMVLQFLLRKYPLWLKFISFHILLIPTIFHFWQGQGVLFFSLIIYIYAYLNINKLRVVKQKIL